MQRLSFFKHTLKNSLKCVCYILFLLFLLVCTNEVVWALDDLPSKEQHSSEEYVASAFGGLRVRSVNKPGEVIGKLKDQEIVLIDNSKDCTFSNSTSMVFVSAKGIKGCVSDQYLYPIKQHGGLPIILASVNGSKSFDAKATSSKNITNVDISDQYSSFKIAKKGNYRARLKTEFTYFINYEDVMLAIKDMKLAPQWKTLKGNKHHKFPEYKNYSNKGPNFNRSDFIYSVRRVVEPMKPTPKGLARVLESAKTCIINGKNSDCQTIVTKRTIILEEYINNKWTQVGEVSFEVPANC